MPTTANYSWPTPADTDLVKDGAEAIRDLGNAIDSTVFANSPGLVHINTFTVSGASSHSFGSDTNPIFSSSYDNYQIVVFCTSGSAGSLSLRLRANITDLTSTVYDWQETLGNGTSGAFQRQTSQTTARVNAGGSNDNASTIINLFNPFLARDKSFSSIINYAASPLSGVYGGNIRSAVSYNGFSLIGNSGNFNAKVSIYGWKI